MKKNYLKRWKKIKNLLNIKIKKRILYIFIFFEFITIYNISKSIFKNNKNLNYYNIKSSNNHLDYENNTFVILRDMHCSSFCGLLSFYFHYLGCLHFYLYKGYIPIIDLTFPNIFNAFKSSKTENPWELFFEQPFGYNLANIQKYAKNIKYVDIISCYSFSAHTIYHKPVLLDFYHTIIHRYIPIKKEIINESNGIMSKLFKGSNNVLGILARGTDYIAKKPKWHPIPPKVEMIIKDIKEMEGKYNYDYYFLTTEDVNIRENLIKEFGNKLKFLKPKKDIEYNYSKKQYLNKNKNLHKNIDLNKVYLKSIYILSNCIDIISARTGGALILFMMSDGFRNKKIYYLGSYI